MGAQATRNNFNRTLTCVRVSEPKSSKSYWFLARTANPDFSVLYIKKEKTNNSKPEH